MVESKLYRLIKNLEYGTNIHICVVFLNDFGNVNTILPSSQNIHSKKVCDYFKSLDNQQKCIRCRNLVLKKIIRTQKPFGGVCINGIYEYCLPVVINNKVVCVIFIGNILPEKEKQQRLLSKIDEESLVYDLQHNYSFEQCRNLGEALSDYIKYLIEDKDEKNIFDFNPLIENIKNYIEENFNFDFAVSEISKVFNYNEKYLGKVFKAKTGYTIKEYINYRRVDMAKDMLKATNLSVIEISLKVGFNNVTYFNKIFKRLTNLTPMEYRRLKTP